MGVVVVVDKNTKDKFPWRWKVDICDGKKDVRNDLEWRENEEKDEYNL